GEAAAGAGATGPGGAVTCPLPSSCPRTSSTRRASPGWVATSSLEPLSNSSRHSSGTASGFSRYCSRIALAKPALSPSTSCMLTSLLYQRRSLSGRRLWLEDRVVRDHGDREAADEAEGSGNDRELRQARMAAAHRRRDEREQDREGNQPHRVVDEPDQAGEDRESGQEAGNRVGGAALGNGRRAHRATGRVARATLRPGEPCGPGRGVRPRGRQGSRGSGPGSPACTTAGSGGFGSAFTAQ